MAPRTLHEGALGEGGGGGGGAWAALTWMPESLRSSMTLCSWPFNLALVKMSSQKKHLVGVVCNNIGQVEKQCTSEFSCAPENTVA